MRRGDRKKGLTTGVGWLRIPHALRGQDSLKCHVVVAVMVVCSGEMRLCVAKILSRARLNELALNSTQLNPTRLANSIHPFSTQHND